MALLVARASMTGFLVFDFADRYPEAMAQLAEWVSDGRLKSIEYTQQGTIADFPTVFNELFAGQNTGKLVLELT